MMVEPVATVAHLGTILAGVGEGAGEVDVLHVFPQVGAIRPHFAAQRATMRAGSPFRPLLNINIQLAVCI